MKYFATLFFVLSFVSVFVTVYDKIAAKKHIHRISEATLLLIGLLGGATAMFITMCVIRHKTRRAKFMVSLPIMSVLHVLIAVYLFLNIT